MEGDEGERGIEGMEMRDGQKFKFLHLGIYLRRSFVWSNGNQGSENSL